MNPKSSLRLSVLCVPISLALVFLAGCSTQRFYANYYINPKPPRLSYGDLKPSATPQPVYILFDMYVADASLNEATRRLGPKVVSVVEDSHLFSRVAKVGSENMARLQITMKDAGGGLDTKNLPEGLTSNLKGSKGVIVYQFSAAYQAPGKEPVKKMYPHAVHVVEGESPQLADVFPLTASHAVDAMVEQVVLRFLRDLQRENKL